MTAVPFGPCEGLAPLHHNNPPAVDPEALAALAARVSAAAETAGQWLDAGTVADDADASRLADFLTGLGRLAKEIDAARKEAKRPHDEAGAAVQAAFAPLLAPLDTAKGRLKTILGAFADRKDAAQREERDRLVAEAQGRLEAAIAETERAERAHDLIGLAAADHAREEAEKALKALGGEPKVRIASATGGGRTMGVRTLLRARITAMGAALAHYRQHPEVIALIERLATADLRAARARGEALTIPGITATEERSVA